MKCPSHEGFKNPIMSMSKCKLPKEDFCLMSPVKSSMHSKKASAL